MQGLKEGKIPGLASRRSRRAVLAIAEFLEEVLVENDQDQG